MKLKQFVVEDVRCFAGRQEFEIKPLTFLVGENSTGKSTMLGCFQVLSNYLDSTIGGILDFNVEPYSMGSFNDIVTRTRGKPLCKEFKLGFVFEDDGKETISFETSLVEKEQSAEPILEFLNLSFGNNGKLRFAQNKAQKREIMRPMIIDAENTNIRKNEFSIRCDRSYLSPFHLLLYFIYDYHTDLEVGKKSTSAEKALAKFVEKNERIIRELSYKFDEILKSYSFAPIRSRPKRTYDPMKEFADPEGSNMPTLLRNMQSFKQEQWKELQEQLTKFGRASGLFEIIEIKTYGKSTGDPFQIQVKVRGPRSNIMDVGYGVSQILPILTSILSNKDPRFFLLQQPEVHLHPIAQAELTSLFVKLTSERKHSFIIETHSDYMVDRARIEIQKDKIKPEDVSLIYLGPKGPRVKVHNIGFDKMGNLTKVPPSFRKFFLKETAALLGSQD